MRSEYSLDYSKAVRGKYRKRLLAEKSSIIVLGAHSDDSATRFRRMTPLDSER